MNTIAKYAAPARVCDRDGFSTEQEIGSIRIAALRRKKKSPRGATVGPSHLAGADGGAFGANHVRLLREGRY
jgi:hypothetical protein